jgi:hypothetical protein
VFTFPGLKGGVLPDGRYRATLGASSVSFASGQTLAADHTFGFFFLRGDVNHDGTVNRSDFRVLLANYGKTDSTFSQGDSNYDTKVDRKDFTILIGRYMTEIFRSRISQSKGRTLAKLVNAVRSEWRDGTRAKNKRSEHDRDDDDDRDDRAQASSAGRDASKNGAKTAKKKRK